MTNPQSFDELFDQIADLLSLAQKNKDKGEKGEKLGDEIDERLDNLELGVTLFREITNEAIKRSGLEGSDVQKTIEQPEKGAVGRDKRLLERAKKLREEVELIEREYALKSQIVKLQKKKKKTAGKKRKKKFKRLGGQGWMPM